MWYLYFCRLSNSVSSIVKVQMSANSTNGNQIAIVSESGALEPSYVPSGESGSGENYAALPFGFWWLTFNGTEMLTFVTQSSGVSYALSTVDLSVVFIYNEYEGLNSAYMAVVDPTASGNGGAQTLSVFAVDSIENAMRRIDLGFLFSSDAAYYLYDVQPVTMFQDTDVQSTVYVEWSNKSSPDFSGVSAMKIETGDVLWSTNLDQSSYADFSVQWGPWIIATTQQTNTLSVLDKTNGKIVSTQVIDVIGVKAYSPESKYFFVTSSPSFECNISRIDRATGAITNYVNLYPPSYNPSYGVVFDSQNESTLVLEYVYSQGERNRTLVAFDASTMKILWSSTLEWMSVQQSQGRFIFSLDGQSLFLLNSTSRCVVSSVDSRSGAIQWQHVSNSSGCYFGSLVIFDPAATGVNKDYLFFFSAPSDVSVNGLQGSFDCILSATGALVYKSTYFLDGGDVPTPVGAGQLLVQNFQGTSFLIQANSGKVAQLGSIARWSNCHKMRASPSQKYIIAYCGTRIMVGAWPEFRQLVIGTTGTKYNYIDFVVVEDDATLHVLFTNPSLLSDLTLAMFPLSKAYLEYRRQLLVPQ